MFHVEIRQFPHVARAFNLSGDEVRARIVAPWTAGQGVEWEERRWAPDRARLTILEGPELATADLGMGRGWANAVRVSEDVTTALLSGSSPAAAAAQPTTALKSELLGLAAADWVDLREAVRLAAALYPQARPSEQLGLAEQAVWELLHEGRLDLGQPGSDGAGAAVGRERWQELIMAWASWSDASSRVAMRAREAETAPDAPASTSGY